MQTLTFDNKTTLEQQLAEEIALQLRNDIHLSGRATLLLSGGSTPKDLYKKLSQQPLEWSKVIVGLVDERYVENTSEFSNEKLVKECLLVNHAKSAKLLPMVTDINNINKNIAEVGNNYTVFVNATVTILGMGGDGHTASLFPNDAASEDNLTSSQLQPLVIQTYAPAEPKTRISCSKQLLLNSKKLYLMITGEEKQMVLQNSTANKLPIAHFLQNIIVYYTKN